METRFLLIALLCSTAASGDDDALDSPDWWLTEARKCWEENRHDRALLGEIAETYLMMGDVDRAIAVCATDKWHGNHRALAYARLARAAAETGRTGDYKRLVDLTTRTLPRLPLNILRYGEIVPNDPARREVTHPHAVFMEVLEAHLAARNGAATVSLFTKFTAAYGLCHIRDMKPSGGIAMKMPDPEPIWAKYFGIARAKPEWRDDRSVIRIPKELTPEQYLALVGAHGAPPRFIEVWFPLLSRVVDVAESPRDVVMLFIGSDLARAFLVGILPAYTNASSYYRTLFLKAVRSVAARGSIDDAREVGTALAGSLGKASDKALIERMIWRGLLEGGHDEAAKRFAFALERRLKELGADDWQIEGALAEMAEEYAKRMDLRTASRLYRRIGRTDSAFNNRNRASVVREPARIAIALGHLTRGEIEKSEDLLPPEDYRSVAPDVIALGLARTGREDALDLLELKRPLRIRALTVLARKYLEDGDRESCVRCIARAREIIRLPDDLLLVPDLCALLGDAGAKELLAKTLGQVTALVSMNERARREISMKSSEIGRYLAALMALHARHLSAREAHETLQLWYENAKASNSRDYGAPCLGHVLVARKLLEARR